MTAFRLLRPRSLRYRLIFGAALLAITAVVVSEAAGIVAVRSSLTARLDSQLADFRIPGRLLADVAATGEAPRAPDGGRQGLPTDFRVHLYDGSGRLLDHVLGADDRPGARLPASFERLGLEPGEPATVSATSGDGGWRVLLQDSGADGAHAVIALPTDTVEGATSNLLWFSAALLAAVVCGVVLLGLAVVRFGLLPLTRMERTARRIADGDLALSLPDTDPRTETGRLSQVLNSVLERLREALRRREESEARLRRFIADAGHELRTPLTSIQGFAELALQDEVTGRLSAAERREAQRLIVQNAERMHRLVEDLVLLAGLDREPAYASEPVDLLSVAADTVSSAAVQHPGRHVGLGSLRVADAIADGPGELDVVAATGDATRLRQVAANLLANALTHTPPGTGVRVHVGTTRAAPGTGGADRPGRTSTAPPLPEGTRISVLEVADTGPGLSRADAARVFERFYRADPARERESGGAGLGLAIAAAIAEGHRGRIELDTAPGEGCTFRLVLPAPEGGAH
ncbi:ATP-binding protein [Streptomyces sp. NPDC004134]|uniref:ATP-binding protein n=1 Tax=Streptomyces sp. NPDC004134 TaxID=3364691 RepID=UPI003681F241